MFWGFLAGSIISIANSFTFEKPVFYLSVENWLLTLGHGGSVALAYIAMNIVTKYVTSTVTSMAKTLTLVVLLAFQYTLLRNIHPGNRNVAEVIGVVMVIAGNIMAAISHREETKDEKDSMGTDYHEIGDEGS